ncbi:MAG TPA: TlpA disulfide reductase family protein [Xanthomonadales bacterium]|nr:TlpA disulfide reductase family protein [Xanthomonadales bacterium]
MASRTNLAIVGVAVLFGLGGFAASRWLFAPEPRPAVAAVDPAELGERYVDVQLPDVSGRPRRLSEWDGRPRLVNFWATWCAPCVREMPLLDRYAREHPELAMIGIALDDPAAAAAFARDLDIGYAILVDTPSATDSSVVHGNRRGVLPFSVFIDADGVVRAAEAGDFDDAQAIDRFIGQSNAR